MENTQWESKKQAEVRAGSNNQKPKTKNNPKSKTEDKHKKPLKMQTHSTTRLRKQ